MSDDIFDGVRFYIEPDSDQVSEESRNQMLSLLSRGSGKQIKQFGNDVTHVICTNKDFEKIKKTIRDSSFCCFVTPKWVFISQTVHYGVPCVFN